MKKIIFGLLLTVCISSLVFAAGEIPPEQSDSENKSDRLEILYSEVVQENLIVEKKLPIKVTPIDPFIADKQNLVSLEGVYVSGSKVFGVSEGDILTQIGEIPVKDRKDYLIILEEEFDWGDIVTLETFCNGWKNTVTDVKVIPSAQSLAVEVTPGERLYHIPRSGHLYGKNVVFMSRGIADEKGFEPCKICFPTASHLTDTEKELNSLAWIYVIQNYFVIPPSEITNPEEIKKVDRFLRVWGKIGQHCRRPLTESKLYLLRSDDFNAFVISDGSIFITKGLFDIVDSDEEIAAVLAHESGHYSERHLLKRYQADQVTKAALSVIGIAILIQQKGSQQNLQASSDLINTSIQFFSTLFSSGYSRETEIEADIAGLSYLTSAGYDPNGMIRLLNKFQTLEERHPNYSIFQSHPPSSERVAQILKKVELWKEKGWI